MARSGRNRSPVPRRLRVFVACEGESERSYVRVLQAFADDPATRLPRPLHFQADVLQPGAGDPLGMVLKAREMLLKGLRHGEYFCRCVLLDDSGFGASVERDARALALARQLRLRVLRQQPDHEGFLLRHLPGCDTLRPPSGQSFQRLKQHWPEYEKGYAARDARDRISLNSLRAAANVEPDLRDFLRELEFPI